MSSEKLREVALIAETHFIMTFGTERIAAVREAASALDAKDAMLMEAVTALEEIERRDRGYVMPSDALDPSRIIEHQPGCNVLYMGAHAVRARAIRTKLKAGR